MRFKAIILSLCFLVYMTELAALPVSLKSVPHKTCCMGKRGMAHGSCSKAHKKNAPAKDCNSCGDCLNCPLCYTGVMTDMAEVVTPALPGKTYQVYKPTYSYQYHATAWKPPNFA